MTVRQQWPTAQTGDGMYESFYLRAVSPDEPVAVWIRYTVQKAPGKPPKASVWFTMFDAKRGRPLARKRNADADGLSAPASEWIRIGDSTLNGGKVEGEAGDARWSLRITSPDLPLQHLAGGLLYRAPLPKTKPESPAPFARFEGRVECGGRRYELNGWPGMLGHNWGPEHAWTWIWLSGTGFMQTPDAWIDVVLGRVRVAGRLTPWVANGAISIDGRRTRLGGMFKRGVKVEARLDQARMTLPGEGGASVELVTTTPRESTIAWQYGSPDGHIHDVLNCSLAQLDLRITDDSGDWTLLTTDHGGTYELGVPNRQDWVEPEPIPDAW